MKKALLIGNGVTAQLIYSYKDKHMIELFKRENNRLYQSLNNDFAIFRTCSCTECDLYEMSLVLKEQIIEVLRKCNILDPSEILQTYFCEFGLVQELRCDELSNIESILKVAHLFQYDEKSINEIRRIANNIYYNNGKNGKKDFENNAINIKKFELFLNGFDEIFTTNYDYILDEIYKKEVAHLHGGFSYLRQHQDNGEDHIIKSVGPISPYEAYLIWGTGAEEKQEQTVGGFSFSPSISFPINFDGYSEIADYYENLKTLDITEIHIWGHSGLNDRHINDCICQNQNITTVYKYCNPMKGFKNSKYEERIRNDFQQRKHIVFVPWDDIWDKIKT